MRTLTRAVLPPLLFLAAMIVATPAHAAEPVDVVGYDVQQTPSSGFGGWTHDYAGDVTDTGRTIPGPSEPGGSTGCPCPILGYAGGGGSLNDGVVTNSTDGTHLFTNRTLADGPVVPVITLHLAQPAKVEEIRLIGGDIAFNAFPGAITSVTVEISGQRYMRPTIDAGTTDVVDLRGTPLADVLTDRIVISDVTASFLERPLDQFVIGEIEVHGTVAAPEVIEVGVDVAPGSDRNLVAGTRVEVAVLSGATFDAVTDVDRSSLTFGRTGDEASLRSCNPARGVDVDRDGLPDLVCEFSVAGTGLVRGDTTAILAGTTTTGTPFSGQDAVRVR